MIILFFAIFSFILLIFLMSALMTASSLELQYPAELKEIVVDAYPTHHDGKRTQKQLETGIPATYISCNLFLLKIVFRNFTDL